eukprot:1624991-Prymnesium_polylepis.1
MARVYGGRQADLLAFETIGSLDEAAAIAQARAHRPPPPLMSTPRPRHAPSTIAQARAHPARP